MSRQDFFEVCLQSSSGKTLPVVEYDQQRWFVGEPGAEFTVAVNAVLYSGHPYRLTLRLDGQDPGYTKIVYGATRGAQVKADFLGWITSSGASTATYKAFKLGKCQPSQAAATVSSPDDLEAGKVEVKIEKVAATGISDPKPIINAAGPSSAAANKKLQEGKKWFMAPGLKAEAGSASVQPISWSNTVYRTVAPLPSLKVRYDSSEALYLRKALNPRFAPHRAILRQSTNPSIAAMGAEPAAAAAGAAAAGGSSRQPAGAAARVKREAGMAVKRERDVGGDDQEDDDFVVPRSATAAVDVDLTEEPVVPLSVNGRQLAPDELAVCDLCDSDDDGEAPKWQVRKKQHIKVEL